VAGRLNIGLLGISTWSSSISKRSSTSTPAAVRAALERFSTFVTDRDLDLLDHVRLLDLGDVPAADDKGALERASKMFATLSGDAPCMFLGGDNSATVTALRACSKQSLEDWGLVTVDPHLDVRSGHSNGSPVRELIEAGLDAEHVVQIGTADFVNSPFDAAWASRQGVKRFTRGHLDLHGVEATLTAALVAAGDGGRRVFVDLDVDSVDQAAAPGCPSAVPGGLSAATFRNIARCAGRDSRVGAIDLTEVDVERDAPDQRTVRLVALALLEFLVGVVERCA
jgi:formiminoglutamase